MKVNLVQFSRARFVYSCKGPTKSLLNTCALVLTSFSYLWKRTVGDFFL